MLPDRPEQDVLDVLLDTGDAAFAFDASGTVLRWNEAAERITGWKAGEVLGKRCYEVMNGRDAANNLQCWPSCMVQTMARKGERPSSFYMVTPCRGGKSLRLDVSTILVRDESGSIRAGVHLFRDVTKSGRSRTPDAADLFERLTPREREILELVASGLSPDSIARRLSISRTTLRNHTQNVLDKLGVHSKVAAVALAYRQGLVS